MLESCVFAAVCTNLWYRRTSWCQSMILFKLLVRWKWMWIAPWETLDVWVVRNCNLLETSLSYHAVIGVSVCYAEAGTQNMDSFTFRRNMIQSLTYSGFNKPKPNKKIIIYHKFVIDCIKHEIHIFIHLLHFDWMYMDRGVIWLNWILIEYLTVYM